MASREKFCVIFFHPDHWSKRYGNEFFTVTIAKIQAIGCIEEGCTLPLTYTKFEVCVDVGNETFHRWRRFNDFVALYFGAKRKGTSNNKVHFKFS